jgi:hypothetical protein
MLRGTANAIVAKSATADNPVEALMTAMKDPSYQTVIKDSGLTDLAKAIFNKMMKREFIDFGKVSESLLGTTRALKASGAMDQLTQKFNPALLKQMVSQFNLDQLPCRMGDKLRPIMQATSLNSAYQKTIEMFQNRGDQYAVELLARNHRQLTVSSDPVHDTIVPLSIAFGIWLGLALLTIPFCQNDGVMALVRVFAWVVAIFVQIQELNSAFVYSALIIWAFLAVAEIKMLRITERRNANAQVAAPPATLTDLWALPPEEIGSDETCDMCFVSLKEDGPSVETPCKHSFHANCMTLVTDRHKQCPHCQRPFTDAEMRQRRPTGTANNV